jgi:riboflavin synthase
MFTGLISDVGAFQGRQGGRFSLSCAYAAESIPLGASICCDGACLTVVGVASIDGGSRFHVDVSGETLSKTTLGAWQPGRRVNLERALRAGDELGGHIVTGHVDGLAQIIDIAMEDASRRLTIEAPDVFAPYLAAKGSVALDGVSLTVNRVEGKRFAINIIPHTLTHTAFGDKKPSDWVNLEVDLFARYVARALEMRR